MLTESPPAAISPTRLRPNMGKQNAYTAVAAAFLVFLALPAAAGPVVVIKGVQCMPYSVQGVTYPGCPGDPPPPAADPYQAAKERGDVRTLQQFTMDCARGIALESCMPPPTPHGCPEGRAWSLQSGIAQCVDVGQHYCPAEAPTRSTGKDGLPHCD